MAEQSYDSADWVAILTSMELDLERLARKPADAGGTLWAAPAASGPLPPELFDRAHALLAAQRDLAGALQRELRATARHLSALRSIPAAVASGGAVYLDVTG